MLKLNNPIAFSDEELNVIKNVYKQNSKGSARWGDSRVNDIKYRINKHCIEEQDFCCAYCECVLPKGAPIEHFAPKGKYPDFTFEPLNLTVSCHRCNMTQIKGQKNTIAPPLKQDYASNTFLIVHPRLDNPEGHIKFTDDNRINFDRNNCSPKGNYTIDFFKWDEMNAIMERSVRAKLMEYVNKDKLAYLEEISTYKP